MHSLLLKCLPLAIVLTLASDIVPAQVPAHTPKTIHALYFIYQTSNDTPHCNDGEAVEYDQTEDLARCFDLIRAQKAISHIQAKFRFDSVNSREFVGYDCSPEGLEKAFTSLTCNDSDIVVFYYSGHGYRDTRFGRRLPVMSMRFHNQAPSKIRENGVPVSSVVDILKERGGYLNFVIADCCNTALGDNHQTREWHCDLPRPRATNSHSLTVAICAADTGQNTSFDVGHYPLKKMKLIYDSIVNGTIQKDYLFGSWFTEQLTSEINDRLSIETSTVKMDLTTMIRHIKEGLDSYVNGYHYLQRRLGNGDRKQPYNPFFEITFW